MGGPTGASYITLFSRYSFPAISSSLGYCKTRSDCQFSQMISVLLETSSHCNRTGWISAAPIKLYHIFLIKSNVFIIILFHYYYSINFLSCQKLIWPPGYNILIPVPIVSFPSHYYYSKKFCKSQVPGR